MDDSLRYGTMLRILTDLEALPPARQADLLQLSYETSKERRAADKALTQWLVQCGWSNQGLIEAYPTAGRLLEEMMAAHRPLLLPYEARTSAADAMRCVLTHELAALPPRPAGVVEILQGPVADVLYDGTLPLGSAGPVTSG